IGEDLWGGVKSYPRFTAEETPTETKKDCSSKPNSEPSADNTICVCKSGYEENSSGKCVKKEKLECEAPLEPSEDESQCLCPTWDGYEGDADNCVKKEESTTPNTDDNTSTDSDDTTTTPNTDEPED
ncbi:MAG: hypothetical protein IIZ40_04610, partial [Bacilli bacterium]|nr:hypothetical protein [Bacilli bacterium]